MKAALSLAISAWVGAGVGAAFDDTTPFGWWLWACVGCALLVLLLARHDPGRHP